MSTISSIAATTGLLSRISGIASKAHQETISLSPPESSNVTLSQDAKALAHFASKGISVSLREMGKPLTSQSTNDSSEGTQWIGMTEKSISKDDFDKLLLKLGATEAEKDQIKSGFDSNKDGAISHDELLKGIASTSGNDNSLSQAILGLMDKNGNANGTVSSSEFARFTTAFNDAEK